MSAKSMRAVAAMITGILLLVGYTLYALRQSPQIEGLQAWAVTLLVFIGISAAVEIVVQIVFHIALSIGIAIKEEVKDGKSRDKTCDKTVERIISSTLAEDERDKFISLKSDFVGYICAGAGALAALIALAAGVQDVIALHIAFGSFFVGGLAEGMARVFYYERGVRNG